MAVALCGPQTADKTRECVGSEGCIGASQAAALAGVTRQRVCQAIWAGKLMATHCPPGCRAANGRGVWRIRPEDLAAWRDTANSRE